MAETQDGRIICLCPTALMPVKYAITLSLQSQTIWSMLHNKALNDIEVTLQIVCTTQKHIFTQQEQQWIS